MKIRVLALLGIIENTFIGFHIKSEWNSASGEGCQYFPERIGWATFT